MALVYIIITILVILLLWMIYKIDTLQAAVIQLVYIQNQQKEIITQLTNSNKHHGDILLQHVRILQAILKNTQEAPPILNFDIVGQA